MYNVNKVVYAHKGTSTKLVAILEAGLDLSTLDVDVISTEGPFLASTLVPVTKPTKVKEKPVVYRLPKSFITFEETLKNSKCKYKDEILNLVDKQKTMIYSKLIGVAYPWINNVEFKRQVRIVLAKHSRFLGRSKLVAQLESIPDYVA